MSSWHFSVFAVYKKSSVINALSINNDQLFFKQKVKTEKRNIDRQWIIGNFPFFRNFEKKNQIKKVDKVGG